MPSRGPARRNSSFQYGLYTIEKMSLLGFVILCLMALPACVSQNCQEGEAAVTLQVLCTNNFFDPCRPEIPGRIVSVGPSLVFGSDQCSISDTLERTFIGTPISCRAMVTSCVKVCELEDDDVEDSDEPEED